MRLPIPQAAPPAGGSAARAPTAAVLRSLPLLVKSAVAQRGSIYLTVEGASMQPLLRPGDRVALAPLPAEEDPRPGDLVLIDTHPLLLHRYLFRTGAGFYTAGDACASYDPPWPRERIIAVARERLRDGERVSLDRGWRRTAGRFRACCHSLRQRAVGVVMAISP